MTADFAASEDILACASISQYNVAKYVSTILINHLCIPNLNDFGKYVSVTRAEAI